MPLSEQLWILCDPGEQNHYSGCFEDRYDLVFIPTHEFWRPSQGYFAGPLLMDLGDCEAWQNSVREVERHYSRINANTTLLIMGCDNFELMRSLGQLGFSNFLTKPFRKAELQYRTWKMLQQSSSWFSKFNLKLDLIRRQVKRGQLPAVDLTPVEVSVLQFLILSECRPIQRQKIVEEVWGTVSASSKTLDVHVSNLRKKINPLQLNVSWVTGDCYVLEEMKNSQ